MFLLLMTRYVKIPMPIQCHFFPPILSFHAIFLTFYHCFQSSFSPQVKRVVVPGALTTLRLKPGRKFCRVGDLSKSLGWKHAELIEKLEAKRLTRSAAFFQTKKQLLKLKAKAVVDTTSQLAEVNSKLAQYGY